MSNKPFHYQAPFPLKKDDTEYYLLTSEHVSVSEFEGQEILKVAPEALTLLARQAFHDASFMLLALLKASNNILHTFLTKTETSTTFCGSRLLPVGFLL